MALPSGFNPNSMSFGNITRVSPIIEIPRNPNVYIPHSSNASSHGGSAWSRFNNTVARIGDWFAEKAEDALGWVSLIATAIIIITCVVKVISTWIDEGFWMAVLVAILATIIGVIAWYIAAFAIIVGVNIIMYGMRILFWNGWTLIISLVLGIGLWIWLANASSNIANVKPVETEICVPSTQVYQCTAAVLNVRSQPNKYSKILGTLRKGQTVEVYDSTNGFARITYKGNTGYASLKYLKEINNY